MSLNSVNSKISPDLHFHKIGLSTWIKPFYFTNTAGKFIFTSQKCMEAILEPPSNPSVLIGTITLRIIVIILIICWKFPVVIVCREGCWVCCISWWPRDLQNVFTRLITYLEFVIFCKSVSRLPFKSHINEQCGTFGCKGRLRQIMHFFIPKSKFVHKIPKARFVL